MKYFTKGDKFGILLVTIWTSYLYFFGFFDLIYSEIPWLLGIGIIVILSSFYDHYK